MKCLLINPYHQTITEVDGESHRIAKALIDSITPHREELPCGDILVSDSRDVLDTDHNFYGAEFNGAVAFGFSLIQPGPGRTLQSTPTLTHAWIENSSQARNCIQRTYF